MVFRMRTARSAPAVVSSVRVDERTRLANTYARPADSSSPTTQLARSPETVPLPVFNRAMVPAGHVSGKSCTPDAFWIFPDGIVIAVFTVSMCRLSIGRSYVYIRFRKATCSRGEIVRSPFNQKRSTSRSNACDPYPNARRCCSSRSRPIELAAF